uniref:AB hydrolase-1 domain-containing protein n=1 Tax=Tetraselmis sp. GSL018 TaxID=582737 RepID=A0A061RJU7_9CHLO
MGLQESPRDSSPGPTPIHVLIGHSMGGAAAVEEVLRQPEGVGCVVLVSPAVIAVSSGGGAGGSPHAWRRWLGGLWRCLGVAASSAVGVLLIALQPLIVWLLRTLVRSRRFWERGIGSAWYDPKRLPAELVDAYRAPQLVKGWESGMVRFVRAKVAGTGGALSRLRRAFEPGQLLSTAERFARTAREHNIRVLILHGEGDMLVPASNSRRLAALLGPQADLIEIPRCGHQPQEEMPERFVSWVADFISSSQERDAEKAHSSE